MKVSIVIANWNGINYLNNLIISIKDNTSINHEIIVVDNGSVDGSKKIIAGATHYYIDIAIFNRENLGISKAMNQAYKLATGDYILRMDNDTKVKTKGWLKKLIKTFEKHSDCGIVCPTSDGANSEINKIRDIREIPTCPFFCVMFKRDLIDKIGYCDENFGLVYGDDDDYVIRMKLETGLKVYCNGNVFVSHIHQQKEDTKSTKYFNFKWGDYKRALELIKW